MIKTPRQSYPLTSEVPLRWLVSLSTLVATVHAAIHPVEVGLIFPRNDTYSPTYDFPIVFAVQNSQHAELLNLYLRYQVRWGDFRNNYTQGWSDLMWANWSSADPYFTFDFANLNRTEFWRLDWQVRWHSCDDTNAGYDGLMSHNYAGRTWFTTDDSPLKDVDLVAATAEATCPSNMDGVVINVTLPWLADISSDLRNALVDEYANEKPPTDGEVYRKIRQYQHESNALFQNRWWSRLSPNKAKRLQRLTFPDNT
ncbi:hypothetical protein FE257_004533 [Aspergillus nanangensis]|uniref:DUF7136 domain-containing protein n=1 Tax=Aspergillus nanangensis TaxID=2582783 RepID=A0AAD4GZF7_ASPNN|nr:hypothetical protein FE257_004533 [Aspergillus nanangensis]